MNGGAFDISAAGTPPVTVANLNGLGGGQIILGANSLTAGADASTTYAGAIVGTTGGFTKTGTGTLIMSGTTGYTGTTHIQQGTLQLGSATGLPPAPLVLDPGAILNLNGQSVTLGSLAGAGGEVVFGGPGNTLTLTQSSATVFDGIITGSGGAATGTNALDLLGKITLGGSNTYSGLTTVENGGYLQAGINNAFSQNSNVVLNTGSTLDLNSFDNTIGSLSGSGTVILSGDLTLLDNDATNPVFSGAFPLDIGFGGIIKKGSQNFTFDSAMNYVAFLDIQQGGVVFTGGNSFKSLPPVSIASTGFLLSSQSIRIGSLSGEGEVRLLNSGVLNVSNNVSSTFSGSINDFGQRSDVILSPVSGSTFTLSGSNNYEGFTLLNPPNSGVSVLAAGATNAFAPKSPVDLSAGTRLDLNNYDNTIGDLNNLLGFGGGNVDLGSGTLTISGSSTYPTNFSGVISGTGGVVLAGGHTKTWEGVNTYTGGTTINGGTTLALSGAGNLAPTGSVDIVSGTFDISAASGPITIGDLSGNGDVSLGGNTLTAGTDKSTTFLGTITDNGYGGNFTKFGNGILYLGATGQINIDGETAIQGGTLQAGSISSFSSSCGLILYPGTILDLNNFSNTIASLSGDGGTVALGDATLTIADFSLQIFEGSITGTGGIVVESTTLQLGGTNTYSGTTVINSGGSPPAILFARGQNVFSPNSDFIVNGTLDLNFYDNTIGSLAGSGTVNLTGNLTFADSKPTTFTGNFAAATPGALIKQGVGTFTLSTAGSLPNNIGSLQIQEGTFALGNPNILSSTTGVEISPFATFDLGSNITTIGILSGAGTAQLGGKGGVLNLNMSEPSTFAGQILDAGAGVVINGSGIFTLSGSNNYLLSTTINAGSTLAAGATNALSPASDVQLDGQLNLNNFDNTIGALFGAGQVHLGTGVLTINNGSITPFSGVISGTGGVVVNGLLHLNGVNTYTGGTTVNGTLIFDSSGNLAPSGAVILAPGSLFDISAAGSPITIGDLSGGDSTTTLNLGGNTLTAGTFNSTTFGGVITGNGNFVKAGRGTLTLTGNNAKTGYTGTTTIVDGKLRAGATGSLAPSGYILNGNSVLDLNGYSSKILWLSGGGYVTLGSGTLIVGNSSVSSTYTGAISGTGGLSFEGSGTLTIAGNNTYSGPTFIDVGTLEAVNGALPSSSDTTVITSLIFNQTTPGFQAFYSGDIDGTGGVTVAGPGTITLLGSNSYTGGTIVSSGSTLSGNTSSLQGAIADSGTVTFDQAFDGTFAGTLSGSGSVIKTGTGKVSYTNNMTAFSGNTSVDGGILALNAILGGNLNVNNGGKLTGTGTLRGLLTVNRGGTVAPGNSIGTLNVNSFVQNQGSFYEVQIDNLGNSSLINVAGAAVINGGTVIVTAIDDLFKVNTPYVIVNSGVGVSGSYDGAIGNGLVLNGLIHYPELFYTSNRVIMEVQPLFIECLTPCQCPGCTCPCDCPGASPSSSPLAGCSSNVQQVATEILSIATSQPVPVEILLLLNTLLHAPANQVCGLVDQLTGEQYTSNFITTELLSRQFIRRLYDPLRSLVTSCPSTCYDPCLAVNDFWFEGSGTQIFSSKHGDYNGFRLDGYEVTAGLQSTFLNYFTLGIAGSYEHDRIDFSSRGRAVTRTYYAGAYGLIRLPSYYFLGDFAYGKSEQKLNRPIHYGPIDGIATGKPDITSLTGYAEFGKDFCFSSLLIQPFIAFEYDHFTRAHFQEEGVSDLNLYFFGKDYSNIFSRLGFHLSAPATATVEFSLDLAWQCKLNSQVYREPIQFLSFGSPFDISGQPMVRNSLDGALTISKLLGSQVRAYAELSGQVWSHLSTYSILAGLEARW